jgi:pyridoxal phosphate-dependent aminotransferase EpsN
LINTSYKKKIFLSPPHMSGNEQKYINEAFETNWIAPIGPNIDAFEKEIANYVRANEAVAVSSGTAAIHLALLLLDVKEGDTVFCSSLTFVASANPIIYQKAEPVFIDSEPDTWNMSPQALETAFKDAVNEGKLPKAVIVVNLYGQSAKMDEILSICDYYHVPIIEDAAESLGSIYKGKASGTFGKFGIYSFNGNKIITTSGGGMLISNDTEALRRARFLATQARDPAPHYQHSHIGFNYRMSNILAGLGRAQVEVLDERVEARRLVFERYYQELAHLPGFYLMPELENTRSNRWLTALIINEAEAGVAVGDILNALMIENIEARPVWKPLHLQPIFQGVKYYQHSKNESISEHLFKSGICLPSGSNMNEEDQLRVINCIKQRIISARKKGIFPISNNLRIRRGIC